MSSERDFKKVKVVSVAFFDELTDFCIFIGLHGTSKITFKGTITGVQVDQFYDIKGVALTDSRGNYVRVSLAVSYIPESVDDILNYLAQFKIPGLGKKSMEKLAALGVGLFDVLSGHELPEPFPISGIKKSALEALRAVLKDSILERNARMFIAKLGLGYSLSSKIFEKYGNRVESLLLADPYLLMYDIDGVGFEKADAIALRMGVRFDSVMRFDAYLFYVLQSHCEDLGSTVIELEQFTAFMLGNSKIPCDRQYVATRISELTRQQRLHISEYEGDYLVGRQSDYIKEKLFAKHVWRLSDDLSVVRSGINVSSFIEALEKGGESLDLEPQKLDALNVLIKNNFSVLTGGPGTGKTHTVKFLIKILIDSKCMLSEQIALCAPTGIAAKILQQASGFEAKTIHRLLKSDGSGSFFHNQHNQLNEFKLFIVDEFSMVDLTLGLALLSAIPTSAQVILVGDEGQLQSVERGALLRDMLMFEKLPRFSLTVSRRFDAKSGIGLGASLIREGIFPDNINMASGSVFFKVASTVDALKNELANYVMKAVDRFGVALNDIQVLTPRATGELGSARLSDFLRPYFNPCSTASFRTPYGEFWLGDRVMVNANLYDKGVFNGDLGYVSEIKKRGVVVTVSGVSVEFIGLEVNSLNLAYALSVHKSQGGQFPVVIMAFHPSMSLMLYRSNVYTGFTRSKDAFIGIGCYASFHRAISRDISNDRVTLLLPCLRDVLKRVDDLDLICDYLGVKSHQMNLTDFW